MMYKLTPNSNYRVEHLCKLITTTKKTFKTGFKHKLINFNVPIFGKTVQVLFWAWNSCPGDLGQWNLPDGTYEEEKESSTKESRNTYLKTEKFIYSEKEEK